MRPLVGAAAPPPSLPLATPLIYIILITNKLTDHPFGMLHLVSGTSSLLHSVNLIPVSLSLTLLILYSCLIIFLC